MAAADLDAEEVAEEVESYQITPESVASWVFGGALTRISAMTHADRALDTRLRILHGAVSLSAVQREKLDFAGRGDIARFFDEYEALKRALAPRYGAATFASRQAYADAKADFVTRITDRAVAEGFPG